MFSDTHFHLVHTEELGIDIFQLFNEFLHRDYQFLQDVGTLCDDLPNRKALVMNTINKFQNEEDRKKLLNIIHFSAGIFPDINAIKDRENQITELTHNINRLSKEIDICAIGECGLDHHWNIQSEDHRNENDFTNDVLKGEEELFELQLELAKKMNKPVIVHSRDAFEGTLSCIKNINYHNGEIHCYSYGIAEAKSFLDLGWYIALGGKVTYAKKNQIQQMVDLVRYIPKDRLLLETDSPYLAPVPYRGQVNTPLFIESIYKVIADILCMSVDSLCKLSAENSKKLFCTF